MGWGGKLLRACPEETRAQQCSKLISNHSAGLKMLFGMRQSSRNAPCFFQTAKVITMVPVFRVGKTHGG